MDIFPFCVHSFLCENHTQSRVYWGSLTIVLFVSWASEHHVHREYTCTWWIWLRLYVRVISIVKYLNKTLQHFSLRSVSAYLLEKHASNNHVTCSNSMPTCACTTSYAIHYSLRPTRVNTVKNIFSTFFCIFV